MILSVRCCFMPNPPSLQVRPTSPFIATFVSLLSKIYFIVLLNNSVYRIILSNLRKAISQYRGSDGIACTGLSQAARWRQHCVNCDRPSQWEMANFDPSQKQNPWADCNKIPHNWLRPREDTLDQIWHKSIHWGLLGIWVKYNVFVPFLFIYTFFSETRVQVRPVDGFLRAIAH